MSFLMSEGDDLQVTAWAVLSLVRGTLEESCPEEAAEAF